MLLANYAQVNRNTAADFGAAFSNPHAYLRPQIIQNFYVGDAASSETNKSGFQNGYSEQYAWAQPRVAGGLSAARTADHGMTGTLVLAGGRNALADTTITVSQAADISALTFGAGTATLTVTQAAELLALGFMGGAAATSHTPAADLTAVAPITASDTFSFSSSANLAAALYALGEATVSFSPTSLLMGVAVLDGAAASAFSVDAAAAAGKNAVGSADITITAPAVLLGGVVDLVASAAATVSTNTTIRATGALSGDITPYTELSPQNLAAAVWNAVSATFDDTGSMGEKLNAAGAAGDPWVGNIEGALSAGDVMRIILAAVAGETTITDNGNNTATVVFKSQDGATARVTADMVGSERTQITLDP